MTSADITTRDKKTLRSPPGGNLQRMQSLSETTNNSESACEYYCGICNQEVDGILCASVECGGTCGKWIHSTCCGLPKKLPSYLINNRRVAFFCKTCTPIVPHTPTTSEDATMIHDSVQLSNRFSVLEEKVFAQDKKLDLILGSIVQNTIENDESGCVDEHANSSYADMVRKGTRPRVNPNNNPQAKAIAMTAVKACFEEEKRHRSVVIENLHDSGDHKEDDWHVLNILDELRIDPLSIDDLHRMPRFRAPQRNRNSRPRLVKVVLKDSFTQRTLLANARNLQHSDRYCRAFIRRSMSSEERSHLRDLKYRCYMLNQEANPDFDRRRAGADNRLSCFNVRNEKVVHFIRRSSSVDYAVERGWKDVEGWRDLATNHRDQTKTVRGRRLPHNETEESGNE